jgi:hypothetical protein
MEVVARALGGLVDGAVRDREESLSVEREGDAAPGPS